MTSNLFYQKILNIDIISFIILFVNNTLRLQTQTGTKCCRVSFRRRNAPCYQVRLLLFFLFFCCLFFLLFLCLFASSSSLPSLLYEKLAVTNWCFFFFWETYWLIPFNLNLKMTIAVQGAVKLVFFLRQTKRCPRLRKILLWWDLKSDFSRSWRLNLKLRLRLENETEYLVVPVILTSLTEYSKLFFFTYLRVSFFS